MKQETPQATAGIPAPQGREEVKNLDLLPLFEDAGQRGYLDPSWYLIAVEAGFEIWQGGAGLSVRDFSVALKGAA